ncbi:MAG: BREX system P-loop protein BrxC, partial [Deltaproteobacteria bacterium]|nr:BREX system P-loop protein BrxC [Deltaproteobacteria bacterium]
MKIKELFEKDVTRDIPPVVYFHEQNPEKLKDEVSEYIITGGYPDGDPRAQRVGEGIHEQFVKLLKGIAAELQKAGGAELPASWISGFYGSGKSIFAKLIGLSLDGKELPNGTSLSTALLQRDDSPRCKEFEEAWKKVVDQMDPMAVVFDIGGVARDNEHIHVAALRQIQSRLGYCPDDLVAEYELKLEHDGQYDEFLQAAETTLGRSWNEAKNDKQADDHFSHVMHVMDCSRYPEPTSWIDAHAGGVRGLGSSVREITDAIALMMKNRAYGKTLFIVVDEVSQYVHQDDQRMLKLQSFVSEVGQRLKGGVWLFATGQQKLEESGDTSIGKLKDRFPIPLRVHLNAANIRDVVHKRLLKKARDKETVLRELFQTHRSDLKLHGYECGEITEEDFVEVYPLIPAHVDLLLQITTTLRARSSRVRGDDYAIRGLLQLMGELFREQRLAEKDVGDLVTLDAIFEVQRSALEEDIQNALSRIFSNPDCKSDELALRCAKAVALLQLIQESTPTTPELVAKCLYSRLGEGNREDEVAKALERLRAEGLLSYSEKYGFKIQSSVGQEWQRERDDLGVTMDQKSELVQEMLKKQIGNADLPRLKSSSFSIAAWYSDGRHAQDARLVAPRVDATLAVDFRYLAKKQDRESSGWVTSSDQDLLRDRILWVCGDPGQIEQIARDLASSINMINRYEPRFASLPGNKKILFFEEQTRRDDLEKQLLEAVSSVFMDGALYFRGRQVRPKDLSASFPIALNAFGNQVLPELFPHFIEIRVTDTELKQLLEPTLSGPSTKFMDAGLGILSLDSGRYVASCDGTVPTRIFEVIERDGGASGSTLLANFGKPPYAYPADVIKACLAGLVRGEKIRVRPEDGPLITSVRDPGAQDLFLKDRDFRRAEFFP